MATIIRRKGKRGVVRYTVRVRKQGRAITETFGSKAAAESWARARETTIETGEFRAVEPGQGKILADLIDEFIEHRRKMRRAPGTSFAAALQRLRRDYGLEPAAALDASFWRQHVLDRIAKGVESQTAFTELSYAASLWKYSKLAGTLADASAPAEARRMLKEEGFRLVSRPRERRLSDAELDRLLAACGKVDSELPLADVVKFALCTAMRRGEILALRWDDVEAAARIVRVRNRKHPRDRGRTDETPLLQAHPQWPRWDALALIAAQPHPRGAEHVFPIRGGGQGLSHAFERACAAAKLKDVVFHLLRHEALSRFAALRKFDALRLQAIGGHRDLRSLNRYAKVSARSLVAE